MGQCLLSFKLDEAPGQQVRCLCNVMELRFHNMSCAGTIVADVEQLCVDLKLSA